MERLVRLKETGDSHELNTRAADFFEKLLKVRSEEAGLIRDARAYFATLGLREHEPEAMEIAIGLLVSVPKGRQRARLWLIQRVGRGELVGHLAADLDGFEA